VRTRVVSWKDAAARKLDVESDAFVTPSRTVWTVAGSPPAAIEGAGRNLSAIGRPADSPASSVQAR